MNNTTTFTPFSAIDYTGVDTLSTYASSITPLKFVSSLERNYKTRLVWDFGDDTISREFTPTKTYNKPGIYYVNLVVYDCNTNAMISSYEKVLQIYDLIDDTFSVSFSSDISLDSYVLSSMCGRKSDGIVINITNPAHTTTSSIFYSVSGSNSKNWWDIQDNKYAHLECFYSLYEDIYNFSLKQTIIDEIDKISFDYVPIYGKVTDGTIQTSLLSSSGTEVVGYSATKTVYYKDDLPSDRIVIDLWKDKRKDIVTNNTKVSLSGIVVDNTSDKYLSITSNGIDGEGYVLSSFNISDTKFYETNIPFVVKIKDELGYTYKNSPIIELSSLVVGVVDYFSGVVYTVEDLNHTLSAIDHKGSFRGSLYFDTLTTHPILSGINIFAYLQPTYISGESNSFNLYTKGIYDIWKKNEDFDPSQVLKDLRFQEILLDKNVLFDEFFAYVLGDSTSDHDAIGVKIYEKIANYVKNTKDISVSEKEYLDGMAEMVNYKIRGENYAIPEKIKRLVNLASLSRNSLIGETNKFVENFESFGSTVKDVYGKNLGDEIDVSSYVVTSGVPIVAYEKFSQNYKLINTYNPTNPTYALSSYSSDWGWPLVLPTGFNVVDFNKYYTFYEFVDTTDSTVVGSVVDYENPKNNIGRELSNTELFGDGGIFEVMFIENILQSLGIFGSYNNESSFMSPFGDIYLSPNGDVEYSF